jgi:hypothetical protein
VLGQQKSRQGTVLADKRPARPAPRPDEFTKPSGASLLDSLSLRGDLVREPDDVPPFRRDNQMAQPLVLITSG